MLHILLVDDEPLARNRLARQLESMPGCAVVGQAASGKEALQQSDKLQPDVVLMDIQMPEMNGLEAAGLLAEREHPPVVIFCTAYDEHALSAFERNALDYLVKPVRLDRLEAALSKARTFLHKEDEPDDVRHFLRSKVGDRVELIPIANVIYLLAEQKYTTVGYLAGQAVIDDTLKSLEDEFGPRFFRIHRNALVARDRLRGLAKDAQGHLKVTLEDSDMELEVSRRNLPALRKLLRNL